MSTQSIFWFRRDLRFIDNHGLFQALTQSKIVNPIFIFDENITKKLDTNDHRLAFIKSQLNNLTKELIKFFFLIKELNCLNFLQFNPNKLAGNIPTSDKTEYLPPI